MSAPIHLAVNGTLMRALGVLGEPALCEGQRRAYIASRPRHEEGSA